MDKKVEVAPIDWKTLDNILHFQVHYNKKTDTLLMQRETDIPAISVDCDGDYWLRVNPKTGEIVGVEIEGFKKVFLKKHPKTLKDETAYVRPIMDLIQLEKCSA